LSIGVIMTNIFFDFVERDEKFYVFSPYSVYKEYGIHLDDMNMDEMYYELVNNPRIKKELCELSARELLILIAQLYLESGYPYVFFRTNANEQNPLKKIGEVKVSNLCTEIAQISIPSTINDYGEPDEIGLGISCVLSSLNIVNVMESKKFRESVHTAMEMLSNVSDMS